jgi:hypothetical protein
VQQKPLTGNLKNTDTREGLALHDRMMQHQNVQFADVGTRTDAANKGTIFVHDGSKASALVC